MRKYITHFLNTGKTTHHVTKQCTQGVQGGNINILGGHSIGHSKQENVYVHVSCISYGSVSI
jgi:hypothetical protein